MNSKRVSKTFKQNMEEMSKMSPENMAAKIKELDQKCVCGMCPTYIGTGEEKLTFCVIGKSMVIEKENGCMYLSRLPCLDRTLRWDYYCTKGSGKELTGMQ